MDRKRQNHGGHRGADNGDPARRGTVVARYTNSLEPGAGPGGWRAPKKNKFYHPAEPPSKLVLRDRGGHLDTRGGAHDTKAQRGQVYAYARGAGRPLVFLLRVAVAVDVGRRPGTWQAAPSTPSLNMKLRNSSGLSVPPPLRVTTRLSTLGQKVFPLPRL